MSSIVVKGRAERAKVVVDKVDFGVVDAKVPTRGWKLDLAQLEEERLAAFVLTEDAPLVLTGKL